MLCLDCCWLLMAVLLGGVMQLIWIAVLTVIVLAKKLVLPNSDCSGSPMPPGREPERHGSAV
jgi:predicted metal-binding membrane protein